jgi:hypothetical protein
MTIPPGAVPHASWPHAAEGLAWPPLGTLGNCRQGTASASSRPAHVLGLIHCPNGSFG